MIDIKGENRNDAGMKIVLNVNVKRYTRVLGFEWDIVVPSSLTNMVVVDWRARDILMSLFSTSCYKNINYKYIKHT